MDYSVVLGLTLVVVFFSSWLSLQRLHHVLMQLGCVALPSARGLHSQPIPRGGGIVIALWGILAIWLVPSSSDGSIYGYLLVAAGLLVVSLIGFADDRSNNLSTTTRLSVHFTASALVVAGCSIITALDAFVILGLPIIVVAVFLTIVGAWSINAMNFMDGSDALVASQVVLTTLIFNIFALSNDIDLRHFAMLTVVGLSTLGFLVKNLPPATMFLGDVGSGFLGLAIVVFVITTTPAVWWSLPVALILYSLFIMDTFVTLSRRMLRGELPTNAHREHAYQRIVRRSNRHADALVVNTCYLLLVAVPLSFFTIHRDLTSVMAVVISFVLAGTLVLLTPSVSAQTQTR